MALITLDTEKLRQILMEAYEAGWYGTLEMKSETVEEMVNKQSLDHETRMSNMGFSISGGVASGGVTIDHFDQNGQPVIASVSGVGFGAPLSFQTVSDS